MTTTSASHTSIDVDISSIWKAAIVQYENTTMLKFDSITRTTSIDQILCDIQLKKSKFDRRRHDGSRLDNFRILVKKSLSPLQTIGEIVVNATKTAYPPSEAIFAAARLLINTANAVSTGYDKITAFLEDLDFYLHRLRVLKDKIPPISELKKVLIEIFTSILDLCGLWTKYFTTTRIGMVFRNLRGQDDELQAAYDHFHKLVLSEEGIVRNAIFAGVSKLEKDVKGVDIGVKQSVAIARNSESHTNSLLDEATKLKLTMECQNATLERQRVLDWLSSLSFHDKQRFFFSKHQTGTGQWFLNDAKFQNWLNQSNNTTLWCHGIPGSGKTILLSQAIEYIQESMKGTDNAIVYVYCNYKDSRTQCEVELIMSIVRQFVEQRKLVPPEVTAFRDKYMEKMRDPTDDERLLLIKSLTALFKRTFIFVDAMDECAEMHRQKFLRFAKRMESFVRFFITSRSHLHLSKAFNNISVFEIIANPHDIKAYVAHEVDMNDRICELIAMEPRLRSEIVQTLTKKAAGMFLLSHLQLLHLSGQSSVTQVRRSLESLPTKIYDLYENALERIEYQSESDRKIAKRALCYISCAVRPMSLEELRHALSVEAGSKRLDTGNLPATKILIEICAGLIRIDDESSAIALVHYTLQEFLQQNPGKLMPEPDLEFGLTCLTYLSFEDFGYGPVYDDQGLEKRLHVYAFLGYAARHCGHHLGRSQATKQSHAVMYFLQDELKVSSLAQIISTSSSVRPRGWHNRFPREFGALHVLSYWGLDQHLYNLLQRDCEIDYQSSDGMTALHLSAQNGHMATTTLLLEKGARIDIRNKRSETALYLAARNGHKKIGETLLLQGADVAVNDYEGYSALDWAVMNGHQSVVDTLFKQYLEVGLETRRRNRALHLAAEAGHTGIVDSLLSNDAEINWKDSEGSTALDWAVAEGHLDVVRTLVRQGADVNSRDLQLHTALHWALPHPAVAKLLIKSGADINVQNESDQSPLLWSAQDGRQEFVEVILEQNVQLDAQDRFGFTALHAAALNGHLAIVQLLLDGGASPNIKDIDGWTCLHAAVVRHHQNVIQVLLDHVVGGADIVSLVSSQQTDTKQKSLIEHMAVNKSNGSVALTGLRWAVSVGRIERVQTLLENGVDIDAEDVGGGTALTIGAWMGQNATVLLLLENGADVNKRERSGRSALHIAAEEGYPSTVQMLVEHGAEVDTTVHGFTALLFAAREGHTKTLGYLIEKGANVNAEDYHGRRTLHWIAKHGLTERLQQLLDQAVDLNVVDRWGRSPIMWAIENDQPAVFTMLLEAGADVELHAVDGSRAIHRAAFVGNSAIVSQLLQKKVEIDSRTCEGFTALQIATMTGSREIVQLLIKRGADMDLFGNSPRITDQCLDDDRADNPAGERGKIDNLFEKNNDDSDEAWEDDESEGVYEHFRSGDIHETVDSLDDRLIRLLQGHAVLLSS